jgi:hypothetical protein
MTGHPAEESPPDALSLPAWLPDWTDVTAYPAAGDTSPRAWAWEFLRRNPKYQLLWETCVRPFYSTCGQYDVDAAMDARARRHQKFARDPRTTIGLRFGLKTAPPPESSGDVFMFQGGHVRWVGSSRYKIAGPPPQHNEMHFIIRLNFPIAPQLKRIGEFAEVRRNRLSKEGRLSLLDSRSHIDLLPLYLRTLDAKATGIIWSKIANILFPHDENSLGNDFTVSKKLKNYFSAACRLRDGGYRYLGF